MNQLSLKVELPGQPATDTVVEVCRLLVAGYTGRDRRAVLAHVRELEKLGVRPPDRIPMIYTVDPALVRVADVVVASGPQTSGEVEVVLLLTDREFLVGVGSDHTDRAHEAIDVAESKAMCAKPLAPAVWCYRDVVAHWETLELRSWTSDGTGRRPYQEGTLGEFLPVDALLDELAEAGHEERAGTVIFGGTLPTLGGVAYGDRFEFELRDPILDRSISGGYGVIERGELALDA